MNVVEDVELIVKTTVVEHVEDLEPDEGIEHDRSNLGTFESIAEHAVCNVAEEECGDQVEDGLSDNHLPHDDGNYWSISLTTTLKIKNPLSLCE